MQQYKDMQKKTVLNYYYTKA